MFKLSLRVNAYVLRQSEQAAMTMCFLLNAWKIWS